MKRKRKKKPENSLPVYPLIRPDDIKKASILLFYNGNKLTELIGKHIYKYKYNLPAFHAALYIGGVENQFINVGKFCEIEKLEEEFRSTRRIDIIQYPHLSDEQRKLAVRKGLSYLGRPYDALGFLSFGKKLPIIGEWFKKIKGIKALPYCSDHCVDSFRAANFIVSHKSDEETAPWHLHEYAEELVGLGKADIKTVWVGKDFH